jgi:hypothetical protein
MHRSAAVRPPGSTRGCFSSCLARTPGCFIRDYETRLTLAGVLHLPTRVTEVRSIGRLRGALRSNCCMERSLMMNWNGYDRRDSSRKRGQTAPI